MATKKRRVKQPLIRSSVITPAQLPIGAMLCGMVLVASSVAAEQETKLPTVLVKDAYESESTGYQVGTTRVGKVQEMPKDIPQSVTIVNENLMHERNANTFKEALRNVAGLTFNAGEGGRIGDNITLRGYSAVGDLYLDGMRDIAQYNRETFNLEQIDVLRGSSSMLFGRGSTGGVINQVSKQPFLTDRYKAMLTVGSYNYERETADLNKKLDDTSALRLNLMNTDTESFREDVEQSRSGVAPTLKFGIGTENEYGIAYYRLKEDNIPDYGVPYTPAQLKGGGKPLDVPIDRFYGLANADYERNDTGISTINYKHTFDVDTAVTTVLRKADYDRDLWATAPRLKDANTLTEITDATVINRQRQARGGVEHTLTSQTDLTGVAQTGSFMHKWLLGVELIKESAHRWSYVNGTAPENTDAANPTTTVGDVDSHPALPNNYFTSISRTKQNYYHSTGFGAYGQDTLALTDQWKLLMGARWDRMNARYDRPLPQGDLRRVDAVWSYRSGVLYQPDDMKTYYASYGTSFNPSAELYQLDDRSVKTDPEKSRNIEIGAKHELFDGDLSLRTSLSRSEKTNERNTDLGAPADAPFVLSGRRHTDALELEAIGRITPKWEAFVALARMWANIDEALPNAQGISTEDNRPINTPDYTFNLWNAYSFGGGWKIGGGLDGAGKRYGNATNLNEVPGYTRWDAMAQYEKHYYTIKVNALNVFNTEYYESVYAGHTIPGAARTLQLTTEVKF